MLPAIHSVQSIGELYRESGIYFESKGGFHQRKGKEFRFCSMGELYRIGEKMAAAWIRRGLQKGEFVGLFADSGIEWLQANYAIQLAGAVDVPRGTDSTAEEMQYIIDHSGMRRLILGTASSYEKWRKIASQCPKVEEVFLFPSVEKKEDALNLKILMEEGEALDDEAEDDVTDRLETVQPDDLFTLIYTSGTTGAPKGVQLSHANMLSQLRSLPFIFGVGDRFLSILPIWHIYERVFETMAISRGCLTWFTSVKTIRADLTEVRPTMMASAPRLWENLYNAIRRKVEEGSLPRRILFRTALSAANAVREMKSFFGHQIEDCVGRSRWENFRMGCRITTKGALLWLPHLLLNTLVLSKLRKVCGGCLTGTISGGGALPPDVDRFFNNIGIRVCEGYGLTETCPVIAVRTFENLVLGTVGPLYPYTQVCIIDPETDEILFPDTQHPAGGRGRIGEIHVRGPQVMLGYYKDKETTDNVMSEDGWFATGDLGQMTFNDCLKITGRCKETIVLSNGENLEPVPIENRLTESKWISQCMVVGQDRKFPGALIVPSLEDFQREGIPVEDAAACARHPEVKKRIESIVRRIISPKNGFKSHERIQGSTLLPGSFEVGEELTHTFKLKRHVVTSKFEKEINDIYKKN